MVVVGCVGAAASLASGLIGMGASRARERAAARARRRLTKELNRLENSRQAIVNPYENVKDLSSMITNPYANIGVATKAAEFEAEQIDISLANTLDVIKSTGSAGSATSLANAALKAKQNVSASIEQQEAENEKLKAQGEREMQQLKMAEKQRIQQAEASGKAFVFDAREKREDTKINRVAGQLGIAQQQEGQARADYTSALTGTISGVASSLGTAYQGYANKGAVTQPAVEGLKMSSLAPTTSAINPGSINTSSPTSFDSVNLGEVLAPSVIRMTY
jgi:hypothetical protein